jgi:hypothetical protein
MALMNAGGGLAGWRLPMMAVMVALVAGVVLVSGKFPGGGAEEGKGGDVGVTENGAGKDGVKKVAEVVRDPKEVLAEVTKAWAEAEKIAEDVTREARYREICEMALDGLGASQEMAEFLGLLTRTSRGAAHRDMVLGWDMEQLFSGPRGEKARQDVLLVEDVELRKRMLHQAGRAFGGLGFKEYLDSLTGTEHAGCQSALLSGRVMAVGEKDLVAGLAVFRELKVSGIDHTCLGDAFMVIFKDLDYAGAKRLFRELSDDDRWDLIHGLRARQGPTVGPYLAYLDEVIPTGEWAKEEKGLCVRLHNLVMKTRETDLLLDWAVTLPERKDTEDVFRVAMRGMLYMEPERAKVWIVERKSSWMRNNGLAAFVQAALGSRGDVEGAKWARDQIDDPDFAAAADGWILDYEKRTGKPFPR